MNEVVDRIMNTFGMMRSLNEQSLEESRAHLNDYIGKLHSAGETDSQRLAVCGLAYLRKLHDGPAPRSSGC